MRAKYSKSTQYLIGPAEQANRQLFIEGLKLRLPLGYRAVSLERRLFLILRAANKTAKSWYNKEVGWIETGVLCALGLHTFAQRKADLIARGYDVRCESRPSRFSGRKAYHYRLFE